MHAVLLLAELTSAMLSLRFLLLRQDKMIRSKALRSIRYVLFNDNVAQDFVDLGLDVFLCR